MPKRPTSNPQRPAAQLTRRSLLGAGVLGLGAAALAACGSGSGAKGNDAARQAIEAAEARRPHTERTVSVDLIAQRADLDLGGVQVNSLVYGDSLTPAPIRANVGDELAVTFDNRMGEASSVHWHGIALRNDMDGAAPASSDVADGHVFTYRFSVPDSGTYWAHPHVGLQTDYGLYVPIIVDDPNAPGEYDAEWIVVLDDWIDGVDGKNPQQAWDGLRDGSAMGRMDHMDHMGEMGQMDHGSMSMDSGSTLLGGDAGDVTYPYFLINGRIPQAPTTFAAEPGQWIRLRIINAGADTAFRVALGGHRMTVTHTDGFPVVPRQVDSVLIGMGERYDVVVTAGDGAFPLVAAAEGKTGQGLAVLRTASGAAPAADVHPVELDGEVGTSDLFVATGEAMLDQGPTDLELRAELGGSMMPYHWTINGRTYDDAQPLQIAEGQRARLTFSNVSAMWHPIHLHGHTFQVYGPDGRPGARKDTVGVKPGEQVSVLVVADNPGQWMLHCHNAYHMESGMMTRLDYQY